MRRMYSLNQLEQVANARVKALVEGGTLENAKPIYCHPVYLKYNRSYDEKIVQLTMLIFNNDSENFTKATFVAWLKALFTSVPTAKILTSGFFSTNAACCITNASDANAVFLQFASTETAGGQAYLQYEDILNEDTILEDGVNKIN